MKKTSIFLGLMLLTASALTSQTTIVNYDFNASSSYPASPASTATGISCSATSSEAFQTYSGVATSSVAFVQNTTAGNALAMANSSGTNTRYFTFQLSGSNLANYQSYKLYMQPQRSTTGATLITVAYSTNGSSYTNLSTTYPVTTAFTDVTVDLSSVTALNNASSVYIKLMASGASSVTGTIRIDNVEIQATQGTGGTGGGTPPWTITGNDVSFPGKLNVAGDITTSNKLTVAGDAAVQGSLFTNSINLGTAASSNLISSVNTANARLIYFGPISNQSSAIVCIPPYTGSGNIFPARITIPPAGSTNIDNQLDFRNDGLSSYIEYGHNSSGNPPGDQQRQGSPTVNTTWPTLKINSLCNGNVEIGFGGGTVSTGKYFEVGYPNRNFNIASNIFTDGIKTAQRLTTVHPTVAVPGYTLYNTQLMVNTGLTHALGILNNSVNTTGDEVFTVFGDGYTVINTSSADAFAVKNPATNTVNFKIKNTGYVYAREINVMPVNITFPDYVFAKNYKLLPLSEVEKYVNSNKHLPNIPSAKEVEANGINLAEMQTKQMEKIEELYLYMIDLKKENDELKERISTLEKHN